MSFGQTSENRFIKTTIFKLRNDTRTCVKILITLRMAKNTGSPFRIRVLLPGMVFFCPLRKRGRWINEERSQIALYETCGVGKGRNSILTLPYIDFIAGFSSRRFSYSRLTYKMLFINQELDRRCGCEKRANFADEMCLEKVFPIRFEVNKLNKSLPKHDSENFWTGKYLIMMKTMLWRILKYMFRMKNVRNAHEHYDVVKSSSKIGGKA